MFKKGDFGGLVRNDCNSPFADDPVFAFEFQYLIFGNISSLPRALRLQQTAFADQADAFALYGSNLTFIGDYAYEYEQEALHRLRLVDELVYGASDQLWGSLMQLHRRDRQGFGLQVGLVMYTRGTFITLRLRNGEVVTRHRNSL